MIDSKITGSINRRAISFVLKNIHIPSMTFKFSDEKVIEINRYAIHHLYGIPNGSLSAPRPKNNNTDLPKLKAKLGYESNQDINAKNLLAKLEKWYKTI